MAERALREPPSHQTPIGGVEDFLDWAERQQERYEFVGGRVRAMASATVEHSTIAANVLVELGSRLRAGPCRPRDGSAGVRQGENFLSPDVTVSCVPESGRTLRHPVLIIEILSPSTANVDRGEKWTLYRTLESLRHYLLIEQHRMAAELLSRNDAADAWTLSLHEGADAVLRLDALDVSLPLSELYRGIDFEAPAA